jgi:APA family basic amino acid/polyamine antiporter
VNENQRDAGLVRSVGTWGLAAGIFNIVVGAGIFAVPAALAASLGPYAPAAFLVCAIAIGSVAICFAEGGSRIPTSGGAYGYIEAAFGPLVGYVAGTLFWFADALACGGIAAAFADVVASPLPVRWISAGRAAAIVAVIGGIALVNAGGVTRGVRLIDAAAMLKLVPLSIFVFAGAGAIRHANFSGGVPAGSAGAGRAMILSLFSFTGMEGPLAASGEVTRPARTIPRALAIAMVSATALYIAIQAVAQGILGPALATSSVPLADAMARVNPALRLLLLAGAAISMFAYISGDILGSPRMLFAFGRDGLLPKFLGRLHPRSHAPYVAIFSYAALAIGFALTGTFAELAVLSTLAVSVLYIGGCAASWKLARRGVALAGAPLNFKWLGTAAVVGIGSMLAMIALASRAEIVGLLAMVGASALIYVVQTRSLAARSARGGVKTGL